MVADLLRGMVFVDAVGGECEVDLTSRDVRSIGLLACLCLSASQRDLRSWDFGVCSSSDSVDLSSGLWLFAWARSVAELIHRGPSAASSGALTGVRGVFAKISSLSSSWKS